MTIDWGGNTKYEIDYEILSQIKRKYIDLINDFIKTKKGNILADIPRAGNDAEKVYFVYKRVITYLENLQYVVSELTEYVEQLEDLLFDELNGEEYKSLDGSLKILVCQEFEHYVKGIVFSFQNELV